MAWIERGRVYRGVVEAGEGWREVNRRCSREEKDEGSRDGEERGKSGMGEERRGRGREREREDVREQEREKDGVEGDRAEMGRGSLGGKKLEMQHGGWESVAIITKRRQLNANSWVEGGGISRRRRRTAWKTRLGSSSSLL